MRRTYICLVCGATGSISSFRGTTDGSYLKCYRCGSTNIAVKEAIW